MNPYGAAIESTLASLCNQVFEKLEGIPEEDLWTWRTAEAHGDINTLYGLATHIVGSGEFWVLEAVGGRDVHRRRLEEFTSTGSISGLRERFDRWLAETHEVLSNLTDDDLNRMYRRDADPSQGTGAVERTIAECIAHALSHVALHLGHLQIQRQLWEQERGMG
jgi:uncharacterized damage-inducible protein DinB